MFSLLGSGSGSTRRYTSLHGANTEYFDCRLFTFRLRCLVNGFTLIAWD